MTDAYAAVAAADERSRELNRRRQQRNPEKRVYRVPVTVQTGGLRLKSGRSVAFYSDGSAGGRHLDFLDLCEIAEHLQES